MDPVVENPQPVAESTIEDPQPTTDSTVNAQPADAATATDTANTSPPTDDTQSEAVQQAPPNRRARRHPMVLSQDPMWHPFLHTAPINPEDYNPDDMPELDMNTWLLEPIPGVMQLAEDPVFVGVSDEDEDEPQSLEDLENWFINNPIDGPLEGVEVVVEDGTSRYAFMADEWTK